MLTILPVEHHCVQVLNLYSAPSLRYKNHEKSKKHKDLVAMIRAHMAEEEGVTLEDGDQGYMEERLGPEGEPDIEEPPGQQRLVVVVGRVPAVK